MKFSCLQVLLLLLYLPVVSADTFAKTDQPASAVVAQPGSLNNTPSSYGWQDHKNLAENYYQSQQYELALPNYQQALRLLEIEDFPVEKKMKARKKLLKKMAKTYRKLGDYYAALYIFQIEVARDPEADWAVQKIGQWMLKYGNRKVGIRWLKRATDMQGSPDEAWSKLGSYFYKKSEYRYIRHLREGVSRFPYLASSWDRLAAALLEEERTRKAERVISNALTLFPSDGLWRTAGTGVGRALIKAYAQELGGEQFTAMGCGPYGEPDEKALKQYMKIESTSSTSEFIIHLGDLGRGMDQAPESRYANMAEILSSGNPKPTFVVLGDNDWNDTINPERSLLYWKRHIGNFHQRFDLPFTVKTQPRRDENFGFKLGDVMYIGINLPEGRVHDEAEWTSRISDNAEWIQHSLTTGSDAGAAVIMAHAPADVFDGSLLDSLRRSAVEFAKPLLFLHANGHKWSYRKDEQVANLLHVQTSKLHDEEPYYPPVQIRYSGLEDIPFVFDRRIGSPEWRVQTDSEY